MRTITYFKENGLDECINYGTFGIVGGTSHDERVEYAITKGVPDDWTHCMLGDTTVSDFSNRGHRKEEEKDEKLYWLNITDEGLIEEYSYYYDLKKEETLPDRLLSAPSAHGLDLLLKELKFGRTAMDQRFLDGCIAMYNNLFQRE